MNKLQIENKHLYLQATIAEDEQARLKKIVIKKETQVKELKNEPYILSRYLIDIAKAYSAFYNQNKVLSDDIEERNARLYLINVVGNVLKNGAQLLGIKMPKRM